MARYTLIKKYAIRDTNTYQEVGYINDSESSTREIISLLNDAHESSFKNGVEKGKEEAAKASSHNTD
jgi:hypothetical protein